MAEISPIIYDFGSGEVSPRFEGRVDLELYRRSCRRLENFVVNSIGNAIRRSGERFMEQLGLTPTAMKFLPFIDGDEVFMLLFTPVGGQVYVYKNNVQVHSFNTGTWATAELPLIQTAQSAGTMYITEWDNAIHKIVKGVGDTTWTLSTPTIAPFSGTNLPKACTFYEQRLIVGGTRDKPQTLFGSDIGTPETFTLPGITDEDGFEFEIATDYGQTIMWVVGEANLLVGTNYGEFQVYGGGGSNNVNYISPLSISIKPFSAVGSTEAKAQISQDNVVFAQRSSKAMRELIFGFDVQRYQTPNISFLADHIVEAGIKEFVFASNPEPIVWMLLNDDTIAAVTRDRQQNVLAWHKHPTDGDVKAIGLLPAGPNVSEDQLWLAVERNGDTDPCIEYILPERFVTEDEIPVYLDSCVIVEETDEETANAFTSDTTGQNPTGWVLGASTQATIGVLSNYNLLAGDVIEVTGVVTEPRLNGHWKVNAMIGATDPELAFLDGTLLNSSGWAATGAEGTVKKISLWLETDQGAGTVYVAGDLVKLSDFVGGGWDEEPMRDRVCYVHYVGILPDTFTYLELWEADNSNPIDPRNLTAWTTAGTLRKVVNSVSGLDHLEGLEVDVLTDGGVHPSKTVVSGEIDLEWAAQEVVAGLGYDSFLKPQRIEVNTGATTLQGMKKKIFKCIIRFFRTIGGEIGYDEDNLIPILFREGDQPMNQPPTLFTGDKDSWLESEFDTEGNILIAQRQPLPMTVVAIIPRTFIEEGTR